MKNSLPKIFRKATLAAGLLGLALILTGCTPDQEQYQDEQLLPTIHSTSYGQSAIALPQDLRQETRHHHRHSAQTRHHSAQSAEVLLAGN